MAYPCTYHSAPDMTTKLFCYFSLYTTLTSHFSGFFCAFWGKLDFTKRLKTRFFPLKLDFSAIFINKIFGKRQKSTVFKHKSRTSFQKWRNSFSKIMKLVFKKLKLVFKMLKLVFKTPTLPCPAFSLQGLGWIPNKKSLLARSVSFENLLGKLVAN